MRRSPRLDSLAGFLLVLLATATFAITVCAADTPPAGGAFVVHFPDANLEAVIREAISKPAGDILNTDLEPLTELDVYHSDVADITGLEYCVNLDNLNLRFNTISDLTSLAGLTSLTVLDVSHNPLPGHVAPLAGLTGLHELYLCETDLEDISALGGLTALVVLELWGNDITDVTPLGALTQLQVLKLSSNHVTDVAPLAGLTALQELALSSNGVTSIAPLAGLSQLTDLSLNSNDVADITPLAGLAALQRLTLGGNEFTDLTPLAALSALEHLSLSRTDVSDLAPLAGLTSLEYLGLGDCGIVDLTPLAGLMALESLYLSQNQLTNLDGLGSLASLAELDVHSNQIANLDGLAGLTNLQLLEAYDNEIVDISGLSDCVSLVELRLETNNIAEIAALAANPGIGEGDEVRLTSNPLSQNALCNDLPVLLDRGADVTRNGVCLSGEGEGEGEGERVAYCDYWPLAEGNRWEYYEYDFGQTTEITDQLEVNGFRVWEATSVSNGWGGPHTTVSYLVMLEGWLFATDNLADLDVLPDVTGDMTPRFPEWFTLDVPNFIPLMGGDMIPRTGALSDFVDDLGAFPMGDLPDVLALTMDDSPWLIFGRDLGLIYGLSFPLGLDITIVGGCEDGEDSQLAFTELPRGGWYEEGSPLELAVSVTGAVGDVSYQWRMDGIDLPGETYDTLLIDVLAEADQGWYSCRVSDAAKAILVTDAVFVDVVAAGSLPAAGAAGLGAAALACAWFGLASIRRRR